MSKEHFTFFIFRMFLGGKRRRKLPIISPAHWHYSVMLLKELGFGLCLMSSERQCSPVQRAFNLFVVCGQTIHDC